MAAGKYKTDANYDDDIDFIKDSDPVQGDPSGTDPDTTPLTGPINVVIQKIVGSLVYLKNAVDNFSVSRMTDSVFGTGRIATKSEAEGGSAHGQGGPLLSPLRGLQLLRATVARATTTRLGTVERATQTEATTLTDTERYLTAKLVDDILRHTNAQATTARRGTVQRATQAQAEGLTNDSAYLTATLLSAALQHSNAEMTTSKRGTGRLATQAQALAGTSTDLLVSVALAKAMIEEFAPVNKLRTGYGLTSVTLNSTLYKAIADAPNGNAITVPSGETFMGGKALLYRFDSATGHGHVQNLKVVNNTIVTEGNSTPVENRYFWEFWTRE